MKFENFVRHVIEMERIVITSVVKNIIQLEELLIKLEIMKEKKS